ncbi:hypothetical protein [Catenuloplanes indicus]|uniref:DUF1579 domain-containing protein n=1 Tax=Catenuloplanes indicus TaxID=137267 RepID=A0AAE4AWB1_9ACTN|nr:hypothetical protein [Catenuloplanes indicus]MDQ0364561.1 hypothetical protein [Catenuloplanes indicus]
MTDGRTDFDFIFGSWRVRNRKPPDNSDPGCTEWVEFDATAHAEPILGGLGHIDRIRAGDFEGLTLRQFDPDARVWRIWWASSNRPGHLDPPLEGTWCDGTGVLLGDDGVGGRPVRLRFEWTTDGADSARRQQEFSYDGGQSWRLNWVMELTRDPAGGPSAR